MDIEYERERRHFRQTENGHGRQNYKESEVSKKEPAQKGLMKMITLLIKS